VHYWKRVAVVSVVTGYLVMVWNFCLVCYLWREVHYLGWLSVLVISSKIVLSVKVKVLRGGLYVYGWVTI
jgi:hypothetical protein